MFRTEGSIRDSVANNACSVSLWGVDTATLETRIVWKILQGREVFFKQEEVEFENRNKCQKRTERYI